MKPKTTRSTITAIGAIKIERHPRFVTNAPHTTGANAGPNVMVHPPNERYDPSLFFGVTAKIVFIIRGMNTPEPTA